MVSVEHVEREGPQAARERRAQRHREREVRIRGRRHRRHADDAALAVRRPPAIRGATITTSWPSASRSCRIVSTAVGTPPSIGK